MLARESCTRCQSAEPEHTLHLTSLSQHYDEPVEQKTMDSPLVSIVVPIYNGGSRIRRCIDSLTRQSHATLEIILVNDGSTDDTAKVLHDLAQLDRRVKCIHLPSNSGVHLARQQGLAAVTGAYVGFVDADDVVCEDMYERLHHAITSQEADLAICGMNTISPSGDFLHSRVSFVSSTVIRGDLMTRFCRSEFGTGSLCNKLYKASLIQAAFDRAHSETVSAGEDYICNIGVFLAAKSVAIVPEPLYLCTANPTSTSRSVTATEGFLRTLQALIVSLETYSDANENSLRMIEQLFIAQLRYRCYFVETPDDLQGHSAALSGLLIRLASARPQAVYGLIHTFEAQEQHTSALTELKAARTALRRAATLLIHIAARTLKGKRRR